MTAKEFLRSIRDLEREVDRKIEHSLRLRSMAERMTSALDPNRGSGRTSSDKSSGIDRLVDLSREIDAEARELADLIIVAKTAISVVPDAREREVLELRYLNGWGWRRIAVKMGCDRKSVWRLHGAALLRIQFPENMPQNAPS